MNAQATPKAEQPRIFRVALTADFRGPDAGVSVVHYYNHDLTPNVGTCGGCCFFEPGARMAAHVHRFDESFCVVEGVGTRVVEGRREELTDCATVIGALDSLAK